MINMKLNLFFCALISTIFVLLTSVSCVSENDIGIVLKFFYNFLCHRIQNQIQNLLQQQLLPEQQQLLPQQQLPV